MPTLAEIDAMIAEEERRIQSAPQMSLAEIDAEIAQLEGDQNPSLMDMAKDYIRPKVAALETGAAIASGAALQPISGLVGGLQGIANLLPGEGEGMPAADRVRQIQNLAYTPSEFTQETFGQMAEKIPESVKDVGRDVASGVRAVDDFALENLGPAGATVAKTVALGLPEILGPGKIARAIPKPKLSFGKQQIKDILEASKPSNAVADISRLVDQPSTRNIGNRIKKLAATDPDHKLVQQINEVVDAGGDVKGNVSKLIDDTKMSLHENRMAKYTLKGNGRLAKDPKMKRAIRQGNDEGLVAAIGGSSPADKAEMRRIINELEKGKANSRYADEHRAGDIVGENFIKKVDAVYQVRDEAGKKLNSIVKKMKGKSVDSKPAVDQFLSDLNELGVRVGDDGLDFSSSEIRRMGDAQKDLAGLYSDINLKNIATDATESHKLKRFIDKNVVYGKTAGKGSDTDADRIMKSFRNNLNESLQKSVPGYKKANAQYSDAMDSLDSFNKLGKKSFDVYGDSAKRTLGLKARRLFSNTESGSDINAVLNKIQRTANRYGKATADDIVTQAKFVDQMEDLYNVTHGNTLLGQMSKVANRTAQGQGLTGQIIDSSGDLLKAGVGITHANKLQSIKDIIK